MMCVSTMSQIAALEALKGEQDSVTEMVEDYNRRRQVIVKGFRDIGLSCYEPKGAFYAFPSIRCTGMTSEEFAEKLLSEEKVAVVPGSAFGKCGEGYIRCCYATSLADIRRSAEKNGALCEKVQEIEFSQLGKDEARVQLSRACRRMTRERLKREYLN